MYPLLHELSEKPHIRPQDIEHHSESLSNRSKVVMNGLFAIIGWTAATSQSSATVIPPLTALLWCIINRVYYEFLPVQELQKRVHKSGPAFVALLYAIPEAYQVIWIKYQIIAYGGWTSIVIFTGAILVRLLLHWLTGRGSSQTPKNIGLRLGHLEFKLSTFHSNGAASHPCVQIRHHSYEVR
ncbi:hypothetical protein DL96DRAFT_1722580 [Flagelloscypha sp. PMI_526]|nr:hypothetical protein DL96DRAFT_1722580 [Flagelloscypha sp. PMI_526]